jgi:bla regulator protein blaR1
VTRIACLVAVGLIAGLSIDATAQQSDRRPQFEVASTRPSPRAEPNRFGFPVMASFRIEPGGRITAAQITLKELVWRAYGLQPFQVDGGPDWTTQDRFEVAAKAGDGFTGGVDEIRAMLQSLLADRFGLAVRSESKEMPVYALVLARRDGKLGEQLRPSTIACAEVRARRTRARPPQADTDPDCNLSMTLSGATMTARFVGEDADGIARLLTGPDTQRVVINRTGLAGTFDGAFAFTPAPLPGFPPLPGSENGTSIFTAVQEQLGLRLQSDRAPVTVLTIVSAQRPID